MEFTVLLDSPSQPVSEVQIAKLGDDFHHGKFGTFAITRGDVDDWKRNLALLPGGRAPIDEDHMADRTPRRTEASGWITDVRLDGDIPKATVEWTDKGEDAIRNKRYLFMSPTFGPFKDERGDVHDNVLIGAALSNRPFLNMPAITLASEERVSEALERDDAARFYTRALDGELGDFTQALVMLDVSQADRDKAHAAGNSLDDKSYSINNVKQLKAAATLAASKHGNWKAALKLIRRRAKELGVDVTSLPGFAVKTADSRPPMNPELLKMLDLEEGAEDDAIREAIEKLQAKAEPKTLEQDAAAAGKVLLDKDTFDKFAQRAKDGTAALEQVKTLEASLTTLQAERAEERFELAFDAALKDPAGARVSPAEKDDLHHFFTLDAEKTLSMIEARKPIVNGIPKGATLIELDADAEPAQVIAAGLHPDSHTLDQKIRKYMLDHNMGEARYGDVAEAVMEGKLAL